MVSLVFYLFLQAEATEKSKGRPADGTPVSPQGILRNPRKRLSGMAWNFTRCSQ
ncbi:hypothetical protein B4135_1154 [Caldibacillus debilis]|uniref:Uncharacterized protein n=1 Tax=Caldibacillus debilis TaxID=301148 RepID=A0A150MDW6_9BACI|nr:hypothetical protein B4135_1154 [Caldibacillus debilis]